mmetsp:Transcript_22352/g.45612  ORF Transcript_22352/g.45612 Transcript_22352/m.45612 type:complete len:155 (-) Transcript_22352:342-806(-)
MQRTQELRFLPRCQDYNHVIYWQVTQRLLCSGIFRTISSNASQWFLGAKKCLSINKGYAIVGIKSDYHLREVAQYVFNKDIEEEQQINLEHACLQLLKDLEKSATVFAPFIHKERSIIGQIINRTKLNVTSELATALSIGKSYQSRRHIDADMF